MRPICGGPPWIPKDTTQRCGPNLRSCNTFMLSHFRLSLEALDFPAKMTRSTRLRQWLCLLLLVLLASEAAAKRPTRFDLTIVRFEDSMCSGPRLQSTKLNAGRTCVNWPHAPGFLSFGLTWANKFYRKDAGPYGTDGSYDV